VLGFAATSSRKPGLRLQSSNASIMARGIGWFACVTTPELLASRKPAATGSDAAQARNLRPPVILSMILRSPWRPSPTRSSAAVGVAAMLARLSASFAVLNNGSV
jgi:hypothetical protein